MDDAADERAGEHAEPAPTPPGPPVPPAPGPPLGEGEAERGGSGGSGGSGGDGPGAETGAGAEQAEPYGPVDAVLVFVHGMGEAKRSEILLEWAEPMLGRIDWLARDLRYGATEECGVTLLESELSGDGPIVVADVCFTAHESWKLDGDIPIGGRRLHRRIAMIEARWAEAFMPMGIGQIYRWAMPFMWRMIGRLLRLFGYTLVLLPFFTLAERLRTPQRLLLLWKPVGFVVDLARIVACTVGYLVIAAFVLGLGVLLTPILPLVSPLLLIPPIRKGASDVINAIAGSIGDVAAWKERPVRATAMRMVVRDALKRARALLKEDGEVHVLAHSQGAAVASYALFHELDPAKYRVRSLSTVGAAVTLLGRERWRGRPDRYTPVADWQQGTPARQRMAWRNYWATWDPFSAGPIADTIEGARERWRAAYFPKGTDGVDGPEERAVYNTSQPFLDHNLYYANTVQIVDPTIRTLLGERFPRPAPEVSYIDDRMSVIDKKALGLNLVLALPIAILLPTLPLVSHAFAVALSWVLWCVDAVVAWVVTLAVPEPGEIETVRERLSWLFDTDAAPSPQLALAGRVLASILLFALLFWLNQVCTKLCEDSRTWRRCPMSARKWLWLTTVPRAVYALAAAVTIWFAVDVARGDGPLPLDEWWWLAALLLAAAVFVVAEPRFAPAPGIVPAHGLASTERLGSAAGEARAAAVAEASAAAPRSVLPRTRLGLALKSEAYGTELRIRRALAVRQRDRELQDLADGATTG
ncbi:hypothetical protein ACWKWP_13880 [Agromyces soli]